MISCADGEGDIYEVFAKWQKLRLDGLPAPEWLIRCNQDRALLADDQDTHIQQVLGPAAKLIEEVPGTPAIGGVWFEVKTKGQFKSVKASNHWTVRQGRRVRQEIRCSRVRLRPPSRPEHKLGPIDIWVVMALYVIVAWRILYLTKLARECPDLPCDVVFAEEEWKSICQISRETTQASEKPSLREMILMIAHFGGHAGRKGDGPPGPEVMWRGLQCLRCFALAWRSFGHDTS